MIFFRRKKRNSESPGSPPWLKWAVLAFLGLAVIGNLQRQPGTPDPIKHSIRQAADTLDPTNINFDEYKNKILPSYAGVMRVKDVKEGSGMPAVCGQTVKIAYEAFLSDNSPVADKAGKDKPLSLRIGEGKAMPIFEQGITGMKKGGHRSVLAPSNQSYGSPGHGRNDVPNHASVRFEIDLLDISPALPDEQVPYRIAVVQSGQGQSLACGKPVKLHVMMWSVDGKKLFSTKDKDKAPITFTPGASEVFLGLEQGAIGMGPGAMRTLVVPPPFQATMRGNAPTVAFPFPKAQTVLVDIEYVP